MKINNKVKLIISAITVINIVGVLKTNEVKSEGVILSPVGGELNLDEKFEYIDKCQRSGGVAEYSEYAGWGCLFNNNKQSSSNLSPSEQQAVDNAAYADDIFQPSTSPPVIEKEDNQPSTTTKVINTLFDFFKVLSKPAPSSPSENSSPSIGGFRG